LNDGDVSMKIKTIILKDSLILSITIY